MLVALARASTTRVSVSRSKLASPLTVATMLGIRSARRWYWFSTSDHAALDCSSRRWKSLYPQPVSDRAEATANAAARRRAVGARGSERGIAVLSSIVKAATRRWGRSRNDKSGRDRKLQVTPPAVGDVVCALNQAQATPGKLLHDRTSC